MRYTYPAVLRENELGGYDVQFVDFEEGCTSGDDIEDAIEMAAEVLFLIVEEYVQRGLPLPDPTYDFSQEGLMVAVSTDIDMEHALVSTGKAAGMLCVSDARVRQMVKSGQLASKKQGRDNYVYLWSIEQRLDSRPKAGRPRKECAQA